MGVINLTLKINVSTLEFQNQNGAMNQQVRELLITSKEAKNWEEDFNEHVTALMTIVSKVDTENHINSAGEWVDVYQKTIIISADCPIKERNEKPFEFLVFRN